MAAIDADGTDGFVLADLHGNLAAVVDAAESAYLRAVRYDPYGQTAATYDSGGAFPTAWGFQGRLDISPDANQPLYEFGARLYAPAAGAFTQLDTYAGAPGDPLSLNRYLYAAANPWTLIDPDGHRYEMGAGSGTMTEQEYQHQVAIQVSRVSAPQRTAVQAAREAELSVYTKERSLWDATAGQAIGFGQGLVMGGVDAAVGLGQTAWEGSWWLYHSFSPVEALINPDGFGAQWDTNRAVASYLKDNPGVAIGAVWRGMTDPIATDWQSGDAGMAAGRAAFEVASLAVGVGALVKAAKLRHASSITGAIRTDALGDAASVTRRLQAYTTAAAKRFDADPASFLTTRQVTAGMRNASLARAYRGWHIDRIAKNLAADDSALEQAGVRISWGPGPDFVRVSTSEWWDMTTLGQWGLHERKYDNIGYFLDTIP